MYVVIVMFKNILKLITKYFAGIVVTIFPEKSRFQIEYYQRNLSLTTKQKNTILNSITNSLNFLEHWNCVQEKCIEKMSKQKQ